jgi:hypothetical protein
MKKSILDQYNELLFEHDYPEINSLVEFFCVDIRVRSKEEYDYLKNEKKSYIDDIEHFYKYLFSYTVKEKREAQRRYPTMCKYFWDSIEERLQDINNNLSSKLSTKDISTILLTMKSTL